MKILTGILFILILPLTLMAQDNLVLNSGFEMHDVIGPETHQIKGTDYLADNWYSPIRRSPYLFVTPRRSVAKANGGRSAIGLILGSGKQEKTKFQYITGTLSEPLKKGQLYCISFSTILQRTSKWAATDVGILLHHDQKLLSDISDPTTLTASLYANNRGPVKGTKWDEFSGYYRASGGEKYISFGKFGNSDAVQMKDIGGDPYFEMDGFQTKAFYQLDDISVKAIADTADCGCAQDPPNFKEEEEIIETKYPPYLFALDASGSMKKEGLFDTLRQNLVGLLRLLPEGTPVSFVTFASTSRALYSGIVDENTPNTVDSILSKAALGGGTNVFGGLQLGYGSWESDYADSAKMVLISDGAFSVTPKIVGIVKDNYESKGRKLTIIQIGARASGMERLEPYMDAYIHTTASELGQVVTQLYQEQGGIGGIAYNCECEEEYSDTMNYHFVIDYSGSMKQEKTRAITALRYLFERAPDNAMISITSFNQRAEELYVGKKSDITMAQLTIMLRMEQVGGGTDPVPGVNHALVLAESMAMNRYSHVILITDLSSLKLSRIRELSTSIQSTQRTIDLSACAITVDDNGLIALRSQFDETSGNFLGVTKMKFEKDLFYTNRSSCDYTSQPYHYNPAKAIVKAESKKILLKTLKGIMESAL